MPCFFGEVHKNLTLSFLLTFCDSVQQLHKGNTKNKKGLPHNDVKAPMACHSRMKTFGSLVLLLGGEAYARGCHWKENLGLLAKSKPGNKNIVQGASPGVRWMIQLVNGQHERDVL